MPKLNIWLCILLMAAVTYAIRVIPLVVLRHEIKNPTIRSFLFYVPYVTLAVMTFPAILDSTQSFWSALVALIVGILLAWKGIGMFQIVLACCAVVLISEFFLV